MAPMSCSTMARSAWATVACGPTVTTGVVMTPPTRSAVFIMECSFRRVDSRVQPDELPRVGDEAKGPQRAGRRAGPALDGGPAGDRTASHAALVRRRLAVGA